MQEQQELLRIIHFNDVYDLQPGDKEPVGGVARFKTAIDQYRHENTLVLFSGDVFSPSLLSNDYNGAQMIEPLNAFHIDVACFGNHDFDFLIDQVMKLKRQTNFPWLLTNVFDNQTGNRMGDADEFKIFQKGGFKIGLFGLAEKQWIDTLIKQSRERADYIDFVDVANQMVKTLKQQHGCDLIIALTHMMGYNDSKLVQKVDGIDIVLGGHDHLIRHEKINDTVIVKSGTNFRHFSVLKIFKTPQNLDDFTIQNKKYSISYMLQDITKKFQPDQKLEEYTKKIFDKFEAMHNGQLCICQHDINLRFNFIRKNESSYINMIADWYRHYTKADCILVSAGNFRVDDVVHKGPITYGIITNQIPDKVVTKKISGKVLVQALENSVAMYPNLAGRFASSSGLNFKWDSNKQPFHRVIVESVMVGGLPIDLNKDYILGTHDFHACGGDGFSCLKDLPYVLQPDDSITNQNLTLDMVNPQSQLCKSYCNQENPHNQRIIDHNGKKMVTFSPSEVPRSQMF